MYTNKVRERHFGYGDFEAAGAEVTGLMQERDARSVGFDEYVSDLDDLDRWHSDGGSNPVTGDNL